MSALDNRATRISQILEDVLLQGKEIGIQDATELFLDTIASLNADRTEKKSFYQLLAAAKFVSILLTVRIAATISAIIEIR